MGILTICAKCSDLCYTSFTGKDGKTTESDGYVPENIGIGDSYGDYVEMEIDTKTGQIQNWKPVSDTQVINAQKEA